MKINYKFSNLLGTVYQEGNVSFAPGGTTVVSPVGNRVSLFDLKSHRSETLPVESRFNISVVAINPSGSHMLVVNERGECLYVNLVSRTILHRHRFNKKVRDIKFSPDGRKFAVCRDADVQVFRCPCTETRQFNPFFLDATIHASHDNTNHIDWSSDSNLLAIACSDMKTCVCGGRRAWKNVYMYSLGGHTGSVVASFFEQNTYDMFTLGRRGFLVHWECNIAAKDLVPCDSLVRGNKQIVQAQDEVTNSPEKGSNGHDTMDTNAETPIEATEAQMEADIVEDIKVTKISYKKYARHSFHEAVPGTGVTLTCASYHKKNRLLLTGFSNGVFVLHEMPDFNLIHNLSISDQSVLSVSINSVGDWLAIACGGRGEGRGQLLVWEWQSETYVMKQQGHSQNMTCLSYSPDAQYIASGGEDGKVKVWTVKDGFCFVTFAEHSGAIKGLAWTQAGKAIVSASLDGSIRAFDLKRYRNFRTLTTPEPAQFSCLAVDSSGEVVCAGAQDVFDIFFWSLQTGRLLEVVSGHEGPVSEVHFNSAHNRLASVSWDKTLKVWDVFEGKERSESVNLPAEGLSVQFSPDGNEVAVLTLDSQITLYDWRTLAHKGSIECRLDLDPGRGSSDVITAKKAAAAKSFTSFCYSADGEYMLVGGQTKFVCLYHLREELLVKKFQISSNYSLDSVAPDIDRRRMTEFGPASLIDDSDDSDPDDTKRKQKLKLPGVRSGDASERNYRPEIRVTRVQFSPTGRAWAACSTEGLLIYSLDDSVLFDPFQLDETITPDGIRQELRKCNYGTALMMALRLNQSDVILEAFQTVPIEEVETLGSSLPLLYVEKLLSWMGGSGSLEDTRHLHFYILWTRVLLMSCEYNKYTIDYILSVLDRNKLDEDICLKAKETVN